MPEIPQEARSAATWFAFIAMLLSAVTAVWVLALLIDGTYLAHCPYLVAVKHHPDAFTCSDHPRPTNAR